MVFLFKYFQESYTADDLHDIAQEKIPLAQDKTLRYVNVRCHQYILCKTIIEIYIIYANLNAVLKLVRNKTKKGINIRLISEFFSFSTFCILIFMTPATLIDSKFFKKDVRGTFCVLKFQLNKSMRWMILNKMSYSNHLITEKRF